MVILGILFESQKVKLCKVVGSQLDIIKQPNLAKLNVLDVKVTVKEVWISSLISHLSLEIVDDLHGCVLFVPCMS